MAWNRHPQTIVTTHSVEKELYDLHGRAGTLDIASQEIGDLCKRLRMELYACSGARRKNLLVSALRAYFNSKRGSPFDQRVSTLFYKENREGSN